MSLRTLAAPLAALLVAFAVVACGPGGSASTAPAATQPPTSPSASAAPTASESPSGSEEPSPDDSAATGDVTVMVADSEYGEILVDGEGRTLYGFTPDEDSGEPTCYDACEQAWPPLTEDDEVTVGEDLDDSDFTLVERTDGTMQVKVGGWPLYYFANDPEPGDTNGQGLNDAWYVVSPAGDLITE
jgi:predicted lipoprotein with Yx(FWY)xxD motif